MSLYAFANGDPVNGFDPDGRLSTKGKSSYGYDYTVMLENGSISRLKNIRIPVFDENGKSIGIRAPTFEEAYATAALMAGLGASIEAGLQSNIDSHMDSAFRLDDPKARMMMAIEGLVMVGTDMLAARILYPQMTALQQSQMLAREAAAVTNSAVAKSSSFSVIDWTGYPTNLPKVTGPVSLLEGAEYAAARKAADVTNNGLREGFGLRGVGLDIHEIQPVKFSGSPTDPLNKMLLPTDLHRQVVTPFWNKLQRDVSPYIYRPPGT